VYFLLLGLDAVFLDLAFGVGEGCSESVLNGSLGCGGPYLQFATSSSFGALVLLPFGSP
jgi:hypothetical protein